jgi:membrane fusion protein, multidrug efflux system
MVNRLDEAAPPDRTAPRRLSVFVLYEFVTTFVIVCRDAYITTDIALIAPDVGGPMKSLEVSNAQAVQMGELLFTIDPEPFQIKADRQKAALEVGQASGRRCFPWRS